MLAGGAASALAGEGRVAAFDWRQWRSLPVQEGGRQKPLDTLARETFRTISNKSSFSDPQTQQKLDPTALYLTLLFTWQGWDRPASPHGMPSAEGCPGQPATHQPDAWDREPLLLVDSVPLRTALGLPADQKYISFLDLGRATIERSEDRRKEPFPRLGANAPSRQAAKTGRVAKEGPGPGRAVLDVPGRPSRAETRSPAGSGQQNAAMGFRGPSDANQLGRQDGCHRRDSQGESRTAKGPGGLSGQCRRGFQRGVGKLPCRAAQGSARSWATTPRPEIIELEVAYNHWAPFRIAWVCTLLALLGVLLSWTSRWRPFYWAALAFYGAGVLAMLVGFGMRMVNRRAGAGHQYVRIGGVRRLGDRRVGAGVSNSSIASHYVLTAAAAVSTLVLILADACPAILDPSIRPLTPVLRSNFWLAIHVMTIMLSYAAFALAWLIGNIALGFHLRRPANGAAIAVLSKVTYKFLQAGVLLLIIGTFLGASWADYAWGRFWGWDPKEVWALITLLGYLALLHARHIGWVGDFGMAAFSVLCFTLILMAWYGVNFVLGTGLHSYGFGGGGQGYVLAAVAVQFLYVGAATLRAAAGRAILQRHLRRWTAARHDLSPYEEHLQPRNWQSFLTGSKAGMSMIRW